MFREEKRFLPTPAENKRIPAFEAYHTFIFFRLLYQKAADVFLLHGMVGGYLSHINQLRLRRCPAQDAVVRQMIVDDDLRLLQTVHRLEGDEPTVPRPRPH